MEHLVESHLGGYYVSNLDSKVITKYCEECGDSDWIILSWEEGHMIEALTNYFSYLKSTKEMIDNDRISGITKVEAIDNILYTYKGDRNIISNLFEDEIISEEEKKKLIKVNLQTMKSQITMVCEVYPKDNEKVLHKKKCNKNKTF